MKQVVTLILIILSVPVLLVNYTRLLYAQDIYKSTDNMVSISCLQEIPQKGDTVRCEDGSVYTIKDVSQYQQVPTDPALEALFIDAFSSSMPKADAIHFTDIFSDYLFVKNRYEMYRMLYTLTQSSESMPGIQLSIPEEVIPEVLDSWDPEWLLEFQCSHSNKTCCLESWDMYKDGSYQKTVYLAAAV